MAAGWPFGRAVYRSEVMALLVAIDGVERVTAFGFITGASPRPLCDNVVLCRNGTGAAWPSSPARRKRPRTQLQQE